MKPCTRDFKWKLNKKFIKPTNTVRKLFFINT